jgi:hypothetical protein
VRHGRTGVDDEYERHGKIVASFIYFEKVRTTTNILSEDSCSPTEFKSQRSEQELQASVTAVLTC